MSFIDLHNHCFIALDGGVESEAESLKLLQSAIDSDIRIMYVTPRKEPNGHFDPDNETILKACRKLRKLAAHQHLDLDIRYGEEFRIKTDSIEVIQADQVLCYQDTNYVLIEFTRTNVFSKLIDQAIAALTDSGKKILIAHPERYFDDADEGVTLCRKWVDQGCYLQINRTSLTGYHGIYAEKLAHKLIRSGLAHVVATDAQANDAAKACRLDDVYEQTIKKHNKVQADLLFITNPALLTENKAMLAVLRPRQQIKLIAFVRSKFKKRKPEKHPIQPEPKPDSERSETAENGSDSKGE